MKNKITLLLFLFPLLIFAQPKGKGHGNPDPYRDSMMRKMMQNRFGGSSCSPQALYKFQHNFVVQVTNHKSGNSGKDTGSMKMRYYISDSGRYFGSEMLNNPREKSRLTKTIRDSKDSVLIMISDDGTNKRGFCSGFRYKDIPPFLRKSTDSAGKYKSSDFVKTGRSKTICGYVCEEFKKDNPKETMTFWITKDQGEWTQKFGRGIAGSEKETAGFSAFKGMVLEMDQVKKNDQSSFQWLVTEINKNTAGEISTAGYTFPK